MNNNISVVLVDDHAFCAEVWLTLLQGLGYNVLYECNNGKQLLQKMATHPHPDIVLMDINMPELNGFDTTFG